MMLKVYLKACEQPEKCVKALEFVLAHELGHIYHCHSARKIKYERKLRKPIYIIINILTLGIFIWAAKLQQSRNHEKEADAFAYRTSSRDVGEGGIYLFDVSRKCHFKAPHKVMLHALGCFATSFTHTSFWARRTAIKKHLQK